MDEYFALKRSSFLGKDVAYICQNINGPCPLLAVANVLLLRGQLSLQQLATDGDFVSARDLLAVVHRRIVDTNPPVRLNVMRSFNEVWWWWCSDNWVALLPH